MRGYRREEWLSFRVSPELHVCVQYNTAVYLKGRRRNSPKTPVEECRS